MIPLLEKTCAFSTAKSRKSHLKHSHFFKSRSLNNQIELDSFIQHFIINNKKKSYCFKVLESISQSFNVPKNQEQRARQHVKNAYATHARLANGQQVYNMSGDKMTTPASGSPPIPQNIITFDPQKVLNVYNFCAHRMSRLIDAMVYACRHTGCRPIELLKLNPEQWDSLITHGTCNFNGKTGPVVFVMGTNVASLVAPMIQKYTIDASPETCLRLYSRVLREFNKIWKCCNKTTKLPGTGFKMFRCLVAYEGLSQQRDGYGLRQLLRHSRINMTEHYAKKFGPQAALNFVDQYHNPNREQ